MKYTEIPLPLDRTLFMVSDVNQSSINNLTKSILKINKSDEQLKKLYKIYNLKYKPEPIKIIIDTYGGSVYQCMGLIGVMNNSKTPIHTIVTGAAMSCGFIILIHGHKRYGYEYSTPMYHQVSTGFWGKAQDLEEEYVEVKRLQNIFETITLDRTTIAKKKLKSILKKKKDWYFTAEKALKNGVIDEIIK